MTVGETRARAADDTASPAVRASSTSVADVLDSLGTSAAGLASANAVSELARLGPNVLPGRRLGALEVLGRQVKSPLLALLAVTAVASFFLGDRANSIIIGLILALSIGLGFVNEFRAERAAQELHTRIRHSTTAMRDGSAQRVDVSTLVPGDVVDVRIGEVVPADLRLLEVEELECDESVLTGESAGVAKSVDPVAAHLPLAELACVAFMGTVVQAGSGRGVVVATGARSEFGRIAVGLREHEPETEFQAGLQRFSMLLVRVAGVLTIGIFAINVALQKPVLEAALFSLAIAVGITPQLLPAVVSTSLAAGSRELARRRVLVKRLVCIEDLGDVDVLFTDKTGTLTEGHVRFEQAVDPAGSPDDTVHLLGLLCTETTVTDGHAVGGNALDVALWDAERSDTVTTGLARGHRTATLPFDHTRRLVSVAVVDEAGRTVLVTKGAPESVLARCVDVPATARAELERQFTSGNRVVAVATRDLLDGEVPTTGDEQGLTLRGLLVFLDAPKPGAAEALVRLAQLGVHVKVVTGDNVLVATKVCHDLGLEVEGTATGTDLDGITDEELTELVRRTTVFARVSPEDKARIVKAQRRTGVDVAFLGDGVNDALAIHAADVGISVESATDVAKDAADVVLLDKDLHVLADGVEQGRRIFANTIKYVMMGTSSNFGNMFSAAVASAFLGFLPMLPSQILLNNLLYDSSQLAIPTDHVDPEQVERPTRWDIGFIKRFMLVFGPVSSLFDFLTFGLMLWVFHAGPDLFRSGWFVESLATQTLVIFAIRTRRVPFVTSRPSWPLVASALSVVTVGVAFTVLPVASALGFQSLPLPFFLALSGMVVVYLALVEVIKTWFYRTALPSPRLRDRRPGHRVLRRSARYVAAPRHAWTRPRHTHTPPSSVAQA